ncbi:Putative ribonuclease H protein [Arachis hypogaea]|nr:Putative ribonuclease H protein [Arachis hypogaea]
MAIKIDLEKAYDRLKWCFVEETLADIGLPQNLVNLILSCISTPKMRILWNGEELEEFTPSRGIRQGDPISPYIFVLCIERLSQLINAAVDHGFWKPIRLKKDGPPISHLCFADDIILFAEANIDQENVINKCLEAFCGSSGQSISREKTRVFFSKNVGHTVRAELSNVLQFARTDDLGKYLGVPILHSKVSKHTFEGIINKLQARLNAWKASSLSLAGRVTLVKSVLSSMPLYNMQSAVLPSYTCNMIDRICRNFLWGNTEQTKKIHLISWKNVCEPKSGGGLGIRHASQVNQAFMMKAGWGLIAQKEALWARVLRSKYGSGSDIIPKVERRRNSSNLWKGICSSWENVQANCIWRVGDGSLIRFWDHYWIPDVGNLSATVNQVSNITNSSDMLTDFLDVSGQWDIRNLQEVLPEDVVKRIATISPPSPWKEADHIAWGLSSDGQFSIKTAYQNLRDTQATPNKIFQLVWTWKGPERVRTFLWLVIHNAILTNVERSRRHLTTDNACPRCRQHEESILHLLRDCSYARRVWQRLIPANGIHSFFNTSLHDWLILNLTANSYWSCLFGVAISSLWFFRNKLVFKGEIVDAASGSYQIQARTKEFLKVATSNLKPKNNQDTSGSIIRWVRPNGEYIKLNVDGSWFAHRSNAACGGVFRDSAGRYLIGFAGNLGNCSIMHAELWAIVHGLTIAITHGYQNLMVESDSVAAINFIKNGSSSGHHCAPLIQDVRVLTERLKKVSWIHVFREANTVADQLAKKGHDLPLGLHIFDSSPPDISYALLCDCIGTVRLRGS